MFLIPNKMSNSVNFEQFEKENNIKVNSNSVGVDNYVWLNFNQKNCPAFLKNLIDKDFLSNKLFGYEKEKRAIRNKIRAVLKSKISDFIKQPTLVELNYLNAICNYCANVDLQQFCNNFTFAKKFSLAVNEACKIEKKKTNKKSDLVTDQKEKVIKEKIILTNKENLEKKLKSQAKKLENLEVSQTTK